MDGAEVPTISEETNSLFKEYFICHHFSILYAKEMNNKWGVHIEGKIHFNANHW